MATPESRVKEMVKRLLRREFPVVYWHMPVQNGMGAPALDFHCSVDGLYVAIETKAPGKHMTPRQVQTGEQITNSGGLVFTIHDECEMIIAIDVIRLTIAARNRVDPIKSQ
jgi:hypothetical protein